MTGLDLNPAMLAVARRTDGVDWRQGAAERPPFERKSFDVVVSQFGLMFFEIRGAALEEMANVLEPNGRAAIAVWASLSENPGYAAMVNLLAALVSRAVGLERRSGHPQLTGVWGRVRRRRVFPVS